MLNATSHLLLRRGSGAEPVRRRGASGDSGAEHGATAWRKLRRAGPGGGARWLEAAARERAGEWIWRRYVFADSFP